MFIKDRFTSVYGSSTPANVDASLNFIAMRLRLLNRNSNFWLLLSLLCLCGDVLPRNPYKSGEVRADPKGCTYLRCKRGDQCVNRKFWCKNPPCPNMLYCTKSRMESLKGPSTCESVKCSKGFVCLLRVRKCRWGEPCQQRIARCVSEREYYDSPASCVDFKCPSGLRCILRESLCAIPPCKLVKSCADTEDVKSWYEGCKSLGCLSEHECFLRRPPRNCRIYPCTHTPDCSAKSEEELEANEQCHGWVCPKGEECSTLSRGPCKRDSCKTSKSCHKPLMVPINVPSAPKHSWRDDVKLSFYSRVHENLSTSEIHHPNSGLLWNDKISQISFSGDKEIGSNSTAGNFYEFPIYDASNYVPPNSKPSASTDIISGRVAEPTLTSLSSWLTHLKLKTGVDAITTWVDKAEKQSNYGEFHEWLESVKDMLGPDAYNLWIEEVRTMTVTSPRFQKWLPPRSTPIDLKPSVSPDFIETIRIASVENDQVLSVSPKLINGRNDESNRYPYQEMIINGLLNTSMRKNDNHNEESYIFPPKNNTMLMESGITTETPVTFFLRTPTSPGSVPITEWQQFDDRDPRPIEQAYPVHHNFENVLWGNQALFQGFVTVNPMKFQQPPDLDPRFLDAGLLQGQFTSAMNPGFNQGSIDRRLLESLAIPGRIIQTNWSFQQPPNENLNSPLHDPLSDQFFGPVNRHPNQFSMDQRFLIPGPGLTQQSYSDWSVPNRNFYFSRPHTWQSQFGPSLNSQQQDSMNQKFLEPEEYPEHQLQPPLNINPNFFGNPNRQEQLSLPPNTEWPQDRDHSQLFNRRNVPTVKLSRSIDRQKNEEAYDADSNNSTKENTSWMKDFLDQISQEYVTQKNIGTFPASTAKFGYGSWPESNSRRRSLDNVPDLQTKPEDATHVDAQFQNDCKDAGTSKNTLPELFKVQRYYPGFFWLMDPRLYDYYLNLRDRDTKKLYDENDREASSVLSRTHRGDADAQSPLPKASFVDSHRDASKLKHQWPNTYVHDRLYEMSEPRPLPVSTAPQSATKTIRDYDEHTDPLSKINQPKSIGNRKIDFLPNDRKFDSPGQPIPILDLWNPRFRTPMSSVFQKFDKEPSGYRNEAEKERPISTTMAPPIESTSSITPQQVIPITDKYSKGSEVKDYQDSTKNVEIYDDAGIYPLLLSLQGYIEMSKEDEAKNTVHHSKNSTILPVYKVEDAADEEEDYRNYYKPSPDCITDTPSNSDDQVINLFRNANYGGVPDFPNNLKNVFDVEAAMIMKNTMGEGNVKIKDIKWDYEYDVEDASVEDSSRFFVEPQDSFTSLNGPSNNTEVRVWNGSLSDSRNKDNKENYLYDYVVDYEDETIPEDRSNYNFQPLNTGDSLDHEEILEELIDSFYDDPDHKRFKKNRP